jgi:putative ABC transport system permease protein
LAIIRLLGATAGRAMAIVWLQCLGLGLAGGLLGAALGAVAAMAVEGTVAALVPGVVVPAWDPASLLLGVVLGTSLGALAGLPSLAAVRRHRPLDQLRGEEPPSGGLLGWFGAGIGIGALVLLAAWDARSWVLGPVIVLALVMTGAVLAWGFHLLLPLLGRLPWPRRGASAAVLHLAMGNLGRQGLGGPVTAAAIAGAGLLVGLLLVYRSSVLAELDPQKDGGLPSLFVIDLQVDEVEDFRAMLTAEAIEDATLAPVVRARLRTAERSDAGRDADQARALRSREQNLSFRDRLGTGETLVAGRFQEGSGIEASLEERWAQRLGYRLGDTVTVDIQGVPVSATVTSLRRVQWTSFRPNFFILLSPSALAEAPQTWIAALPPLAQESRQTIQSRLAARFPGTTILDLTDVARRLAVLVTQIGRIVELTAALALAAAILVLIGMALVSARRRRADAALLRVLGATRGTVLLGLVGEFTLLGLLAGGAGILASVGVGQLLLPRLLQLTPVIGIPTLALSALALAGACALAGALACLGVLRARPLETLRSEG